MAETLHPKTLGVAVPSVLRQHPRARADAAERLVGTGHRLPGMFRAGIAQTRDPEGRPIRPRTGGLFGFYTCWPVAVGDWFTRVWYFQNTKPKSAFERGKNWLLYWMLYRWLVQYNFSQQDMSVMENIDFEAPERLSGTDSEIVFWRRLVVTKHRGGRNAEYTHHGKTVDIKKPQPAP